LNTRNDYLLGLNNPKWDIRGRDMDKKVVPQPLKQTLLVRFPNGETFALPNGATTLLTKAVLEQFAPIFLREPAAIRVSLRPACADIRGRDECDAVGLGGIDPTLLTPIILADTSREQFKLVFIEPVTRNDRRLDVTGERRMLLLATALGSDLTVPNVSFVTAFVERRSSCFRRVVSGLDWGTFAWFAMEPNNLIAFRKSTGSLPEELLSA
jgi:hypothetical protein